MRLNVQMVQSDLERFRAGRGKFERTQLPFATALTSNTTARAAADSMTGELPVRGVYGLWERLDRPGVSGGSTGPRGGILTHRGGLRLIAAFRDRASYRPKLGFQKHTAASVRANFLPALRAGMARALETAFR